MIRHYQILTICFLLLSSIAKGTSWFTVSSSKSPKISTYLKSYSLLELNTIKSKGIYTKNPENLELDIPFPTAVKKFHFQSNSIHASDFKVLNGSGKDVTSTLEMPRHFRSTTNNRGEELTALSIFSNGHLVLIFSDGNFNYNLVQLPDSFSTAPNQYILFKDSDVRMVNPFTCGTEGIIKKQEVEKKKYPQVPVIQDDTSCRLTEIYWECDHDMFQKGGNTIQGTLNGFEAMFNGTAILYENETINIGVKSVKVWDVNDPYSYQSSFTALDGFMAAGNAANWPGQLAHLLSTRNLSLGGVAYLNALCTSFRYGFSNIDFAFAPLPIYSWTLSTIAHELGHNFSSPHTHSCSWEFPNGDVHQIDSCWNAEGGCQPVNRGRVGTIMSYCHLTGSVNLALGFGPLPGDRIRQGFADMPCVSGTIVVPQYTPINSGPFCDGNTLTFTAEELPGFNYFWTGPNGFSSNQRTVSIPNVSTTEAGFYSLSVKKASCMSRQKKTEAVFNCLQVGATPFNYCAGARVAVPFISTGTFNPGNKFILQLSNSIGQFTNPVTLDTVIGFVPQPIEATLPVNLTLGNGYKFRVLSTNPPYLGLGADKGISISPTGPSPTPVSDSRCGPGSLNLTAQGGSNLMWFTNQNDNLPLKIGRWLETPVLTQTTSYFIQSGSTTRVSAGLGISENAVFDSTSNGLVFDVFTGFRLDTIKVRIKKNSSGVSNGSFTMKLKKFGTTFSEQLVNYSVAATQSDIIKIPLFWRIDPGYDWQINCEGTNFHLQKSQTTFPVKVNGLTTIKSSLNNPGSNDYPYFFDWVTYRFSSCPSRRVEVVAKIMNGVTPAQPTVVFANEDTLACSVSAPFYQWQINSQLYSNLGGEVLAQMNFEYLVRYKLDSCWSEWSNPYFYNPTSVSGLIKDGIQVWPNPGNGQFFWTGPEEKTQIVIFNSAGQSILTKQFIGKDSFDLSAFSSGLYWIRWNTESKSGSVKISKQ